jgi:hypothetical protein
MIDESEELVGYRLRALENIEVNKKKLLGLMIKRLSLRLSRRRFSLEIDTADRSEGCSIWKMAT